jgi:predicted dehydrogenase
MPDAQPQIWATWFGRDAARGAFPTELRVFLRGERVTANLVFTSSVKPIQRVVRILGSRASIEVDFDGQVIRKAISAKLPGAFGKLEVPARQTAEAARTLIRNLGRFRRSEIHYFGGMNALFTAFYEAIRTGTLPPIPAAEIRRVTAIMDRIFDECRRSESK